MKYMLASVFSAIDEFLLIQETFYLETVVL